MSAFRVSWLWLVIVLPVLFAGCGGDAKPSVKEEASGDRLSHVSTTTREVSARRHGAARQTTSSRILVRDQAKDSTTPTLDVCGQALFMDARPADGAVVKITRRMREHSDPQATYVTTETRTDGTYEFHVPVEDDLDIMATAPGYCSEPKILTGSGDVSVRLARGEKSVETHQLILRKTVSLDGVVLDDQERPLAGAGIGACSVGKYWAHPETETFTTTTENGGFRLEGLLAGNVALWVSKPGLGRLGMVVEAPGSGVVVRMKRSGSLSGRVVMADTSAPVARASLSVTKSGASIALSRKAGETTKTDERGEFCFDDLAPGTYSSWNLTGPKDVVLSGEGEPEIAVREGEPTTGVVLRCTRSKSLAGRILDAETSLPLAGVKYWASHYRQGLEKKAETTTTGEFRVTGMSIDATTYFAPEKSGYSLLNSEGVPIDSLTVPLEAGKTETRIEVLMTKAPMLTGRVISRLGGAMEAAAVTIYRNIQTPEGVTHVTDSEGRYEIPAQARSRARLKAVAPNHAPHYTEVFEVQQEGQMLPDIILTAGGRIEGRVIDQGGQLAEGATVTVCTGFTPSHLTEDSPNPLDPFAGGFALEKLGESITGPDGRFQIEHLPEGVLLLGVKKSGWASQKNQVVKLARDEVKRDVDLRLYERVTVPGVVLDSETSKPVQGAEVSASLPDEADVTVPWDQGSCVTDGEGRFLVRATRETTNTFTAQREGYEGEPKTVVVGSDTRVELSMKSRKVLQFIGEVIDGVTRSPILEYEVQLEDPMVRNNKASEVKKDGGRFTMQLPEGFGISYVKIRAKGYTDAKSTIFGGGRGNDKDIHHTFVLWSGVKVKGRVVRLPDRKPAAGFQVSAYLSGDADVTPVKSLEDGTFVLERVPPGSAQVHVADPEGIVAGGSVRVTIPESGEFDAGDIEVGDTGTVRGRVVRGREGKPVAGENVALSCGSSMRRTVTGQDGRFEFAGVPVGPNGSCSAYLPDRMVFPCSYGWDKQLRKGGTVEIEFRLGAATLRGQVVRAGKGVVSRVQLTAGAGDRSFAMAASTDHEGKFVMRDLPSGVVRVRATDDTPGGSLSSVAEEFEIPESGEIEKTLVLPSSVVSGTVIAADSQPVNGGHVALLKPGGEGESAGNSNPEGYAEIKKDGSFRIEGVASGRRLLQATCEAGRAVLEITIPEGKDLPGLEVRLPAEKATLVSVAYDLDSGLPLDSPRVAVYSMKGDLIARFDSQRNSSGEAKIENLAPGTYRVHVGGGYWVSVMHTVTLESGETEILRDVLAIGGTIRCVVVTRDGQPSKGATVKVSPVDPQVPVEPVAGISDSDGIWVSTAVPAGAYRVGVAASDGKIVEASTDIRVMEESFLQITLP